MMSDALIVKFKLPKPSPPRRPRPTESTVVAAESSSLPIAVAIGPIPKRTATRRNHVLSMLALAHALDRMIEAGELKDLSEAARRIGITRARVSQVVNLSLLAPAIQESLLAGALRVSERQLRRVVGCPDWNAQRRLIDTLLRR